MPFRFKLAFIATVICCSIASAASAIEQTSGSPADQVLILDSRRIAAWQNRDWTGMAPMIADDVFAFSVTTLPQAASGKAAFLAWAAQQNFPKTESLRKYPAGKELNNHMVRFVGADQRVAIVTGVLADTADPKDRGETYTAIYEMADGRWQLLRYMVTVNGNGFAAAVAAEPTVQPPDLNGSLAGLSDEEKAVAQRMNGWHDSFARRIQKNFAAFFSDDSIYVRGDTGRTDTLGITNHSRPARDDNGAAGVDTVAVEAGSYYITTRMKDPGGAPEIIRQMNPRVLILGENRDIAILDDIRADATGGSGWGLQYTPAWRNFMHELSVWTRKDPDSDWKMVHWHGAHYVATSQKLG